MERQKHHCQFENKADALPCHVHLSVRFLNMDPLSRSTENYKSHGNEMLSEDLAHIIQIPCY